MDDIAAALPYVLTMVAVLVSLLALSRRAGGNGHSAAAAKDIAEAAGDISEASSKLIDSMSKYIVLLQTQVEQNGSVPIPPNYASRSYDFAQQLDQHFSVEELSVLASSVGLDIEQLTGDSRRAKAMALVVAARNRGTFWHLLENAKKERPNVAWPQ